MPPQIANNAVYFLPPSGPATPTAMNPTFTTLSIAPAAISNVAISNNILTVTANNNFIQGQMVYFSGLQNATFLNGQFIQVTGLIGSGPVYTGFTAQYAYSGTYSMPETISPPTAIVYSVYYFVISGRDLVTIYNSDSVAHHITIFSAPDADGRKSDIVDYAIPPTSNGLPGISEFLVLGSSYFTQTTNGTVIFIADSTLLSLIIRSL
jgi:hypothetical protein